MENNEENSKRHKIYSSSYFINPGVILGLVVIGQNSLLYDRKIFVGLLLFVLLMAQYTYNISEIKNKFEKIEELELKQLYSFMFYSGFRKDDLLIREVDWLLEIVINLFNLILFYSLIVFGPKSLWVPLLLFLCPFCLAYLMNKSKYVRYYKLG
ncbi:MAG: hypothetical protein OEY19_04235 [Gammaproteobacteria bacterium]|nr:hypothetical protein [Gammaproteobacteria bacterium]MDH5629617.1 hypothetical protein [Gammaproteobacteria bacterium]